MKTLSKMTLAGAVGSMAITPMITVAANDAQAASPVTNSSTVTVSKLQASTTVVKNYIVTTNVLNLRQGASTGSKLLGHVTRGTTLIGIISNGWLRITSGVNSGRYVSSAYVKFVSNATMVTTPIHGGGGVTTPTIPSTPINNGLSGKYAINSASLNVRTVANSSGQLAGYLMKSSIVTGTIVNGWLKIDSGMYKGDYVSSAFLTTVSNSGASGTISPAAAENNLRSEIISLAASQAGTTYIWGASQPGYGFDCSGLTSWVYKQVGMSIPRVSRDQAAYATPITANNVKPGDLVFLYDSNGRVYHVGLSLDVSNKTYWNATDAGTNSVQLNHYSFTKLYKYGNMISKFVQ